jgi:trehalose 6-phosphate phosphatase
MQFAGRREPGFRRLRGALRIVQFGAGMKTLDSGTTYTPFLERLAAASERVLMVDYDGTLAPFVVDRDLAFPYPGLPTLIGRIMQSGTRVVLISGRPARAVAQLSCIVPQPEIWGSHGLERLHSNGTYELISLPREQREGLSEAITVLHSELPPDRVEAKPGSVAIHWRGLNSQKAEAVRTLVHSLWADLPGKYPLELLEFDGGLELRVKGRDKGDAVRAILAEVNSSSALAYLGDDRTDEDAFRAIKGHGLGVLVRSEPRPTDAEVWLRPPQGLTQFLEDWLRISGGE